ncbi:isochorismatase family cysteine hydrolase [uncultured Abyssibacter sp.]|uniref:cysteine hydrolase family protein n=1 Tax=uncultured Abyssibacter sp. TaxID=2320202 RepID=UPI0032B2E7B0
MNNNVDHPHTRTCVEPERTALILIDVINDMAINGESEQFAADALEAAHCVKALKSQAKAACIPVIYANDNFGQWRSDFAGVIRHCTADDAPGKAISELLHPDDDDYFVLKPRHSGFFGTTLQILLRHLNRDTLILAGFAADVCVLFTAHDAYMREFGLFVPRDCVASVDPDGTKRALTLMSRVVKADIRASEELKFEAVSGGPPSGFS